MQRLAEYTLGLVLQWEKTKELGRTKKQTPLPPPSERTPRTAFVCEVCDCGVGLLPEWKQSVSVYRMLDREGQAVTAGQR
jgi:hypothetical protein